MSTDLFEDIVTTLSELRNSGRIKRLISEALSRGVPVAEIIEKGLRKGMDITGKKYESGEYFLSELLFAGVLMNEALDMLEPRLRLEKPERRGAIVLGTVRGDIHDIGKNIFKLLAQASGFEVYDLGVDVEPEAFVWKLKETNAKVLGLSALLTTTVWEMKTVIDHLNLAGIRGKVKVLLGGNAVTKDFAGEIGADEAAFNAVEGITICKRWVGEK